jgi:hypothetical protein
LSLVILLRASAGSGRSRDPGRAKAVVAMIVTAAVAVLRLTAKV